MTELPIDENTPRILIVEDEPKLGQLLIDYLRAASYAPTLISHGDQVLAYVRQTPPDLILLDLMLPGTDGLTLCREIRRFSDLPIVMVTAKIEEIDRHHHNGEIGKAADFRSPHCDGDGQNRRDRPPVGAGNWCR